MMATAMAMMNDRQGCGMWCSRSNEGEHAVIQSGHEVGRKWGVNTEKGRQWSKQRKRGVMGSEAGGKE